MTLEKPAALPCSLILRIVLRTSFTFRLSRTYQYHELPVSLTCSALSLFKRLKAEHVYNVRRCTRRSSSRVPANVICALFYLYISSLWVSPSNFARSRHILFILLLSVIFMNLCLLLSRCVVFFLVIWASFFTLKLYHLFVKKKYALSPSLISFNILNFVLASS